MTVGWPAHVKDTGARESTTGLGPKGLHGHPRLVRGVALRTALGKACVSCPVVLIATSGLAMDAPDEGSGPAGRGLARLQRMSGSRGWPWLLGTVA